MSRKLDINLLSELVVGDTVAIRVRQRLQPAGGPGDKVFPPTFATGDKTLKYAMETRRVEGAEVQCCLLDSVASQANRMEEALLSGWEEKDIEFPVIGVTFEDPLLADIGRVTTLQAPHRIADAILRDATDSTGKTLFRNMPEGRAYTDSSTKNATAVLTLCPTALVFGVWDSTGPKGGGGAKFQRVLTSEIVAVGAVTGSKVGSRIDPLGIEAKVEVFHRADDETDCCSRHSWPPGRRASQPAPRGSRSAWCFDSLSGLRLLTFCAAPARTSGDETSARCSYQ